MTSDLARRYLIMSKEDMSGLNDTFNTETTETEVIPETNKLHLKKTGDDVDKDYEYTRGNLYSLIEKGQEALNGILEVAEGSQHARSYEVAGQIIKSVGDTTDKLIDLQTKMKELNKEEKSKGPSTVNNALFVGSTSELSKLLKKGVLNTTVEEESE